VGLNWHQSLGNSLGLWRWALFWFFTLLSSRIERISVSGHYSEINRRVLQQKLSAALGCPRFAYSFVSLMLRQYYSYCDSCPANRQSAANKQKIREKNLLALRICLALPIGAKSAPRFAYKHRVQRSAINISCAVYIAQLFLVLSRSYSFTYFSRTRL
jgi:hypothetical protein